jgi:diguanylate cyclase (GGDEF)-like protein
MVPPRSDVGAEPRRLATALTMVLALCMGALAAFSIGWIRSREYREVGTAESADVLLLAARVIDSLEWRAIAGADVSTLRPQLTDAEGTFSDALRALERSGLSVGALSAEYDDYRAAVEAEMVALASDDIASAREIDESRVDPAFERLLDHAEDLRDAATLQSVRAGRAATTLTWFSLLGAGLATGIMIAITSGVRRRADRAAFTAREDGRFRALVESSYDIISLVDTAGVIHFVSPNVARVFEAPDCARIPVSELLLPDAYAVWLAADEAVRLDGTPTRIELKAATEAGRYLEAIGTPFSTADETVWVWRDISASKQLEQQLEHQAFHDPLTDLANRTLFLRYLDHAFAAHQRSGRPTSLLMCDLDDFKRVNDTLGHGAGDELLRTLAGHLRSCARDNDIVARLGGDEFGVVVDGDLDAARSLAARILSTSSLGATMNGLAGMSIGVASIQPGIDSKGLLQQADRALYAAKAAGKGRYEVYSPGFADVFESRFHGATP